MKHQVARALAMIFHPVVPGFFVALFTAVQHEGGLTWRLAQVAGLVTGICVVFPLAVTAVLYAAGQIDGDLFLEKRESRRFLYPVLLLALGATLYVFHAIYPFPLAFTMTVAALGVSVVLAIGNRWMKPSIHVAGLAAIAVATAWVHGPVALLVAPLVPLVAWARITTRNHSPKETLVGAAIGIVVTSLACGALP